MIRNDILNNWENDIRGSLQIIESVDKMFPAYTLITDQGYGVAIPFDYQYPVNEDFANAKIITVRYALKGTEENKCCLALITSRWTDKRAFSALCEQFVYPGINGEFRKEITDSPINWWLEMKKIMGNKNVESMIYDTLGELWTYDYLIRNGEKVNWTGPSGNSFDLETEDAVIEVKSTQSRNKREITVHGKEQLTPPGGKQLFLFYCVFEMSTSTGQSINDIVYGLANDGYDVNEINRLLASKGLESGKSARDKKFIPWHVYRYEVDDSFPRITAESFVGGEIPSWVENFNYTLSLAGIPYDTIWEEEKNNEV